MGIAEGMGIAWLVGWLVAVVGVIRHGAAYAEWHSFPDRTWYARWRMLDEKGRIGLKIPFMILCPARGYSLLTDPPPSIVLADWVGLVVAWAILIHLTVWTQKQNELRAEIDNPQEATHGRR